MSILTWIIALLLAIDFVFDIVLLVENRKCVREAEFEVETARLFKDDCLALRDETVEMIRIIKEVINGEEASPKEGSPAAGSVEAGTDTDPYLKPIAGELPGAGKSKSDQHAELRTPNAG